jgi:hypothetical protein
MTMLTPQSLLEADGRLVRPTMDKDKEPPKEDKKEPVFLFNAALQSIGEAEITGYSMKKTKDEKIDKVKSE